MKFIGIDPGCTGALSIIDSVRNTVQVFDTPNFVRSISGRKKKNKTDYLVAGMREIIMREIDDENETYGVLESVHAMPDNGSIGNFDMGRGLGLWEGMLGGLGIPYVKVAALTWKRFFFGKVKTEKGDDRNKACELFPFMAVQLARVMDHNRADAILLAEYGRRTYTPAKPLEQPHDLFGVANV